MLFFIWQKQSGTDCFKDLALEHKVMWDRNLCRSPHFKSILILLSESKAFWYFSIGNIQLDSTDSSFFQASF